MKKIVQCGFALALIAMFFATNAGAADAIADWNVIAKNAVKTAGHPNPVASLDMTPWSLLIGDMSRITC